MGKRKEPFSEVNLVGSRTRDARGRFEGSGGEGVPRVVSEKRMKEYRAFLEEMEPLAMRVVKEALKSDSVPIKERKEIALEVLARLHGKVPQNTDADDARKKVMDMSNDELREFILELASETGIKVAQPSEKRVIN